MSETRTGTVKWFNDSKGFGFILYDGDKEAFVHHKDIDMGGFRYLRHGQQVSFKLIEDGDRNMKAVEVELSDNQPEHLTEIEEPAPEPEANVTNSEYNLKDIIQFEEDREHEFKSLQKARDPVKTILEFYIEKYVNAFLNTNGGALYFGIDDGGQILGVTLDRSHRDNLRTGISKLINNFQPSVEPDLYKINFIKLEDEVDLYIIEIHVTKGTANLYMTGSQNFYVRRDGSNFLMPFDMIRSRIHKKAKTETHEIMQVADESDITSAAAELDLGILLAMIFMSWSDENITESDIKLLEERARDEGLDEEEVAILLQATFKPPLLENIVSFLPTHDSRRAAATVAYLTAISDNVLSSNEFKAFDKMSEALGLNESERNDIRKLGAS